MAYYKDEKNDVESNCIKTKPGIYLTNCRCFRLLIITSFILISENLSHDSIEKMKNGWVMRETKIRKIRL